MMLSVCRNYEGCSYRLPFTARRKKDGELLDHVLPKHVQTGFIWDVCSICVPDLFVSTEAGSLAIWQKCVA